MNLTTQRRILGTLTALLLVCAASAIAWSFSSISTADSVSTLGAGKNERSVRASESDARAPDDAVSNRLLRGPLYDPPAQPPRPAPIVKKSEPKRSKLPPLNVTLVGTIIQSRQRLAILADASGKFDIKGEGEALELDPEGMTVQNIESEQVTLRLNDRQSVVLLDRSMNQPKKGNADGTKGGGNRRRNRQ